MRIRLPSILKAIKIGLAIVHAVSLEILDAPWLAGYHNPGRSPDPILPPADPPLDPQKGKSHG